MTRSDLMDIRYATYKMCRVSAHALMAAVAAGLVGSLLLVGTADAATLKSSSNINSDTVTLGDIFDGTMKPETVLGNAPELGKDMVLNATALKNIATNYNVAWEPSSLKDELTIHREARTVEANMITDVIKASLEEKGVKGNFTLTLANDSPSIILPGDAEANVEVANINYQPGRNVFTVKLAAPSVEKPLKTLELSGFINRLVSVPTLTSTTRRDDIISAADIAFIDVPERDVSTDTIIDADDLIGKTATNIITANRSVRIREVANPQLVSRGEDVTILYKVGGMTLSAKGKSMQNGTEGDLIRVTNLSSAKSLSAQVTGDRTVTVQ